MSNLTRKNVPALVASLSRGDRIWAGDCGGIVAKVLTKLVEPTWAAIVYFEGYKARATQACLVVCHDGSFESLSGQMSRPLGCTYDHTPGFKKLGPELPTTGYVAPTIEELIAMERESGCY